MLDISKFFCFWC